MRVALEQRIRELDLVPAQREAVLAGVGHAQARHDGQGERAVDQRPSELGALRVVLVEVDLVRVVGEQREPDVVRLGHRAADPAAVDVADREVLEEAALPACFHSHGRGRSSVAVDCQVAHAIIMVGRSKGKCFPRRHR